ncbi:MAG: UDP-N-acetylmuramate dehydrogenase [Chloroflexi bacterium]|nr:UDP-N-acetylmuramate dehydrogenase [Chloroflexota bacterium]
MSLEAVAAVRLNESMRLHTSFRIGGPADIYVVAESVRQLREAVQIARRHEAPVFILGKGSNLLVDDAGIRGVVIENRSGRRGYAVQGTEVRVSSGVSLSSLARRTALAGLEGLEWAIGVPGTVGGAVVCSAGAYGGSMADVVRQVEVLSDASAVRSLEAASVGFGYRQSVFKKEGPTGSVILTADLALRRGKAEVLKARLARYASHRRSHQPKEPSAGSIFKNPQGYAAGWLIEQVGLKGRRIGDAQISPVHANFIVNLGHATAADVMSLIVMARDKVREQFSIGLEREIEIVGPDTGSKV